MRAFGKTLTYSPGAAGLICTLALVSAFWLLTALNAPENSPLGPEEEVAIASDDLPAPHRYIEVMHGCGPHFEGEQCVRSHAGPGEEYRVINQLRKGVVLEVGGAMISESRIWFEIIFDEPIRYPERVARKQYVASEGGRLFLGNGVEHLDETRPTTTKSVIVDRSLQMLYAFEDGHPYLEVPVSTGIQLTPTPRGTFTIFKKTPSRYMQGPIPDIISKYYDLPGVPWNLYFTHQGAVIHGAYWHDSFGRRWSSGCVNLPLAEAKKLYEWADIGTTVIVRD